MKLVHVACLALVAVLAGCSYPSAENNGETPPAGELPTPYSAPGTAHSTTAPATPASTAGASSSAATAASAAVDASTATASSGVAPASSR